MTIDQTSETAWENFGRSAIDAEKNAVELAIAKVRDSGPHKSQLRRLEILTGIATALKAMGHDVAVNAPEFGIVEGRHWDRDSENSVETKVGRWTDAKLVIPGLDYNHIDIRDEQTRLSRFRSVNSGKQRVSIGTHGDKRQFPQRKDGSFNYPEIAAILDGKIARAKEQACQRLVSTKNSAAAIALRTELKLEEFYGAMRVVASSDVKLPVFVTLEVKRAMTVEQAKTLHAALVAAGVIKVVS